MTKAERRDALVEAALRWYLSGSPSAAETAALARACQDLINVLGPPGLLSCIGCDYPGDQHIAECPRDPKNVAGYARDRGSVGLVDRVFPDRKAGER